MTRNEDKIQYEIVRWLQSDGIWFYSIPNEGSGGNVVRLSRLISMGMRKGAADLVCLFNGARSVYLEVKDSKGTQKPDQKLFQRRLEDLGFQYFIVRSLEDAQKALIAYKS